MRTLLLLLVVMPLAGETVSLPLIPKPGAPPIFFEASREAVQEGPNGYTVRGDTALVALGRRVTLTQASLFFEFAPGTREIHRVRGEAFVPSPYESGQAEITKPVLAEFGMDFGENIGYGIPLHRERVYFYFKFDAGFELVAGPAKLTIPAGVKALFLLDPTDLFFYFGGGLLTPPSDDPPKESPKEVLTGYGVSLQSLIPFRPAVTQGIEEKAREFSGNLLLTGKLPLGKLPVTFTGQLISDVNQFGSSQKAIDPLEIGFGPWAQAGINGAFDFGFPFLKVKKLGHLGEFGFSLGNATAAIEVVSDKQHAYFSGDIDPDLEWIPDFIPLKPDGRVIANAYVSSAGTDFHLKAQGRYAVNAATLGQYTGLKLGDIFAVEGLLAISVRGFHLTGETNDSLGSLGISQGRRVELFIPFDESRPGFLKLEGYNQVISLRIQGQAYLTRGLASIEGRLDTNQVDITVRAAIEGNRLTGSFSVPSVWSAGMHQVILAEAQAHRDAVGKLHDAYREATKDYEFELSLRGMRTIMPSVCDSIIATLNSAERTAHSRIDSRWPWYAPGKGKAKSDASNIIGQHRNRIQTLKAQILAGNVAAALENAILAVLNNQVLVVRVAVVGEVHRQDTLSSTNETRLRNALAGVRALPATSDRKVKAEAAWKAAPSREELMATADAIAKGVAGAIPTIRSVGFDQSLERPELELFVLVTAGSKQQRFSLVFNPFNPLAIGEQLGRVVTSSLF